MDVGGRGGVGLPLPAPPPDSFLSLMAQLRVFAWMPPTPHPSTFGLALSQSVLYLSHHGPFRGEAGECKKLKCKQGGVPTAEESETKALLNA